MHAEAMGWVARFATDDPISILDLGGRDVNGSPRRLFPAATYTVLDALPAIDVDIIADAAMWNPDGRRWDLALMCEVCEHAPDWPAIIATAFKALWPSGRLIVTTAAPGRPPHSGIDGGPLRFGEYYANVDPAALREALEQAGFTDITVDVQPSPADVRAVATKPT